MKREINKITIYYRNELTHNPQHLIGSQERKSARVGKNEHRHPATGSGLDGTLYPATADTRPIQALAGHSL